jgi:hypothetical protein
MTAQRAVEHRQTDNMAQNNLDFSKLITALSAHLQTMGASGKQISPYSGLDLTPTPTVYEQENGMDRSGPLRRLRQMDASRPDATAGAGMNDPKQVMEMLATVMHLQNAQQEGVATTDLRNAQTKDLAGKTATRDNEEAFAKALGFPNMDTYKLVQAHVDQQNKLNLSNDALKERRTASLHNLIQSAGMLPGGEHIAKAALEQLANESGVKVAPQVDTTNQKLAQRAAGRGVPVAASAVNPPAASPASATGTTPAAPTTAMDISRLANTPAIAPTPQLYPAVADQARMLGQPAGSFTPAVFNPAGPTPANLVANPAFNPEVAAAKLNATQPQPLDMSSLVIPTPAVAAAPTNVNGMGVPRTVVPPDKNALLAILANMTNGGQQARRDRNGLLSVY